MKPPWPRLPLSHLGQVIRGVSFDKTEVHDNPGDDRVPILRAGNIGEALNVTDDLVWVPSDRVRPDQMLRVGDVVVAMSSGSANVVGKTAQLQQEWRGSAGAFCAIVRFAEGISPKFGAYWLRGPEFTAWRIAQCQGANIQNLRKTDLEAVKFPVPPPLDQDRIVQVLDATEDLRRLRAEADRRTADLIPALFYDMFGDLAANPKRFERLPLHLVCERITDGTHQPPPFAPVGLPFLFVANIVKGHIDFNTEKFITEDTYMELTRRVRPERGDILYSTVGSYGVAVQVETDRRFAFQRHIGHIKPARSRIDSAFICAQLNTPFVRAQADKRARGVAQKTVNLGEIRQFEVLVPPLSIQRQFAALLTEIRALEARQAESRRRLDDLFHSLLHRAFQGEL